MAPTAAELTGRHPASGPLVICSVRVETVDRALDEGLVEPAERERASALRREEDRRRFLAGRCLAKRVVAAVSDVAPASVQIRTRCRWCGSTDHGKPYAEVAGRSCPVSISHADERVAVAASERVEVGIDIEPVRAGGYGPTLARTVAGPAELDSITSAEEFTRLWVCKEAVLKCTGEGLMTSPTTVRLNFTGPDPRVVDGPRDVLLRIVSVSDGYLCAVAVATAGPLEVRTSVLG
jgi:4'-phosphopantetheinyl transferase